MRLALTGTPGCGKTTLARELSRRGWPVLHLSDFIRERGLGQAHDAKRQTMVVDERKLARAFARAHGKAATLVVEGHLAHELAVDAVLLLRVDPEVILRRLKARRYPHAKQRENAEAEALDVIATEAGQHARAYEVDATALGVAQLADIAEALLRGGDPGLPRPGTVAWDLEKALRLT